MAENTFQRREKKIILDASLAEPLKQRIEEYMNADPYNKDGKPSELMQEFISYPIVAEDAVKRYEALYEEHPAMFWSIHHLINAPEAKRKKLEIILEQLADF